MLKSGENKDHWFLKCLAAYVTISSVLFVVVIDLLLSLFLGEGEDVLCWM